MSSESHTTIVQDDVVGIAQRDLPWEQLRDSTILVTGASGMLPMYCTKTLLALNDIQRLDIHVKALVRNPSRAAEVFGTDLDRPDLELIVGDVTDPNLELGAFTHLIHGASAARPSEHNQNPVATLRANIVGSDLLLERHSASETPGTFLLMSSSEVYGAQASGVTNIDENAYGGIDLLSLRASYSEGKRAAETLTAVYGEHVGFEYRNLRFGHIYGPGMRLDDGRVQADFARDAFNGVDIVLKSAGLAVRTYTYVADAVGGLFVAWLFGANGAYNVADPNGKVSIRELAQVFAAAAEPPVQTRFEEAQNQGAFNPEMLLALDSSKLHGLGWCPSIELADGTRRMVDHLKEVHAAS